MYVCIYIYICIVYYHMYIRLGPLGLASARPGRGLP